jgi:2'-5' RNA ligase
VIVAVPETAALVDPWRERTCADRPSIGIPAHVTLLFPFVPAARLDESVIAALSEVVAEASAFDFTLARTARFPEILYLAPEPSEPFVRLTEAIHARFPAYPPYEGAHDTIVPHLCVARGDPGLLDEAERDVVDGLPIAARADEALLLEEIEADWGRWDVRSRLALSAWHDVW